MSSLPLRNHSHVVHTFAACPLEAWASIVRLDQYPRSMRDTRETGGSMFLTDEFRLKVGLAEQLKGGVIMDVTDASQARIAQEAGAVAVMALERVPADIRKEGGVARMANIEKMREIMEAVSIPVMAKARIGHLPRPWCCRRSRSTTSTRARSSRLPTKSTNIDKHGFKAPFVCGARNLGEALAPHCEGAAMIRTKGEAGSGNVVEAVRHMRAIRQQMKHLTVTGRDELARMAKDLQAPMELVEWVSREGRLPVPNFPPGASPPRPTLPW